MKSNREFRRFLAICALSLLPGLAMAEVVPSKGELVLGEWNYNFRRNKQWAYDNGVPFFSVWTESGCAYCARFQNKVLTSDKFNAWMAEKKIVMNFMESPNSASTAGTELHDCRDWTRNANDGNKNDEHTSAYAVQTLFPFCRLRWMKDGKVLQDFVFIGRGEFENVDNVINKFNELLADWVPGGGGASYAGAVFLSGTGPDNSLQVLAGKAVTLSVPAVRTNGVDKAFENTYVVIGTDGKSEKKVISWAEGEDATNLVVKVPSSTAGKEMKLQFIDTDNDDAVISETKIVVIAKEPDNSSVNPLWIGERTAATLKKGEWTMDYVLATNLTARQSGAAYTFVYFTGALWCPWCKGLEGDILASQDFKDLCSTKNVRLVTMDHPRRTMDPPSLLMYESTAAGVSGAGYLSRKGIPLTGNGGANATDVIARNHDLAYTKVTEGGYARSRQDYAMFPSLCLLRKDGSLVGRIDSTTRYAYDDGTGKKVFPKAANMARINELFLLADNDKWEELDNNWRSTQRKIGLRDRQEATLCAVDEGDVWRVDGQGALLSVKVEQVKDYPADCTVTLKVLRGTAEPMAEVAMKSGNLKDGPVELQDVSIADGNCYVSVTTDLKTSRETAALFTYAVSTESTLVPIQKRSEYAAGAGSTVLVWFDAGVTNRLTGVDRTKLPEGLVAVPDTTEFYYSQSTGSKRITIDKTGTLGYQIWRVGTAGFNAAGDTITEMNTSYSFDVTRKEGESGDVTLKVKLDKATTMLPDRYEWPGDQTLTWKDGEFGAKTVNGLRLIDDENSDGTQILVFKLEPDPSSAIQAGEIDRDMFTLTVKDNDAKIPGRLAITGTAPALARKQTVFAKTGSKVSIRVRRENGAAGDVMGALTTTLGVFEDTGRRLTTLDWVSRESNNEKSAALDLTGVEAGNTVVVTLAALSGDVGIDSTRREVLVKVVAADAPAFAQEDVACTMIVNTGNEGASLEIEGMKMITEGNEVTLKHLSGDQPAGIEVAFEPGPTPEQGRLILLGTPTAEAGTYSFVYQVSQGENEGLTARIDVKVVDPVKGDVSAGYAPNSTISETRIFTDMMLIRGAAGVETNLVGLLSLAIPSSGRLSAKAQTVFGTIPFAASEWTTYDKDTGTMEADLQPTLLQYVGWTVHVVVYPEGTVMASVRDNMKSYDYVAAVPYRPWSESNKATAWTTSSNSIYTVNLKNAQRNKTARTTGDGSVVVRFSGETSEVRGKGSYVVRTPDGKTVSGSSVLYVADDEAFWNFAYLPVFSSSSSADLSGILCLQRNAAAGYKDNRRTVYGTDALFAWTTTLALGSNLDPKLDEQSERFEPFGTFYNSKEKFADCCAVAYEDRDPLDFIVRTDLLPVNEAWGALLTCSATGVKLKIDDKNAITPVGTGNKNFSFTFKPASGEFSGTFVCDFANRKGVTYSFAGVVLPGWGTKDCGSCGLDEDSKKRPFGNGSCWCADSLDYVDGYGRDRTTSVRRGCAVHIGRESELREEN